MSDCNLVYKVDPVSGEKELIYLTEELEKKFVIICDGECPIPVPPSGLSLMRDIDDPTRLKVFWADLNGYYAEKWTDLITGSRYRIDHRNIGDDDWAFLAYIDPTDAGWTSDNMVRFYHVVDDTHDATREYRVRAENHCGNSSYWGVITFGYSLTREIWLCSPTTGLPSQKVSYNIGNYLRAHFNGVWYEGAEQIYNVPEDAPVRFKITDDFRAAYMAGTEEIQGVFWRDAGWTEDMPSIFDPAYTMLPVPSDNQTDPTSEWSTLMKNHNTKIYVMVGEVPPTSIGDRTITVEKYNTNDLVNPTVVFTPLNYTQGATVNLNADLYLLPELVDQGDEIIQAGEEFVSWKWHTEDETYNKILSKEVPAYNVIVKLYYTVTT